ncbi:transmembrane protein, putative (macronuclear) [Tetrahymena thermophila SB210]|uniref:Transmembrane protein, putative n=1 Tax=Tetrahymena thermophila (strain SB210) TaxID=312017 RepID=Q233X1_TETTS|nr:transmembrane protein, putative [Tetrahymena thermophila SB210]EAR91813.1 transmembrane protein, putative [Tetrahymena thermophila SB210]|eukprot:XP_001012058.1 transmembrane protein, putative [Tetrahymena thermophila SB210]
MDSQDKEIRERFLSINDDNQSYNLSETNQRKKHNNINSSDRSKTQTFQEDEQDDLVKYIKKLKQGFRSQKQERDCSRENNKDFINLGQNSNKQIENNEDQDDQQNFDGDQYNADQMTNTQSYSDDSEYFKQDSSNFDQIMNLEGDINLDEFQGKFGNYASWSWSQFFEFFIYHIIYYIFGPFCIIIFYPFNKTYIYKNLGFNLGGDFSFIQFVLWITNLFITIAYIFIPKTQTFVEVFEVYNMWIMVIFRIFSISCKYAMLHPMTITLYKKKLLTKEEKLKDFYLADWKKQTDQCLIEELFAAQQRNEVDLTMFSTSFFYEINDNTYNKLQEIQQIQLESLQFSRVSLDILGNNSVKLVEQFSQLKTDKNQTKSQSFNGMVILHFLIKQFNKNQKFYQANYIVFLIGLLRSSIWYIYTLVYYPEKYLEFDLFVTVVGTAMTAFNFLLYVTIGLFLLNIIFDSHRIYHLMVQMLFLIKPKKDQNYIQTQKYLPTLNLTQNNNFKNWVQLRRLSIEYGKRFWKRGQVNLSFMLLYSIYPAISLILYMLDVFHFCELEIWFMTFDFFITFISVAICLYFSACINYSFVYHISILEEIQIVFRNLQREDLLQSKQEPSNYLYRIILKNLREKTGNNEEAIQEYINNIIESIDDSKNELQLLSNTEPFQCFGFTITFSILKSGLIFLSSILTFSINVYLKAH